MGITARPFASLHMSDMSGFFQVEQVLLPKLNGGKLKGMVRIEVYGPGGDLVASLS